MICCPQVKILSFTRNANAFLWFNLRFLSSVVLVLNSLQDQEQDKQEISNYDERRKTMNENGLSKQK